MRAGCPFFWANHLPTPVAGVSILEKDVDDLVNQDFGELSASSELPATLRGIQIALMDADFDLQSAKGSMRRISPCEMAHAAIKRCATEIQQSWFDDN
eukprot:4870219-Pyramimonas_sp.AAC.1